MSDSGGQKPPVEQPRQLFSQAFTAATVTSLRHALIDHVSEAGLVGDPAFDFVLAVHELVTNAVRHGGGSGLVDLSVHNGTLICAVSDHGPGVDGLPATLPPDHQPGGRGIYLARQLAGALLLDQRGDGTTATVTAVLSPAPVVHPDVVLPPLPRVPAKSGQTLR